MELRQPAPLFTNLQEASLGFRMLGAAGALSSDSMYPLARIALSLGLSHDVTSRELIDHLVAATQAPPIKPRFVSRDGAPCKQNILLGKQATLDRFPIPLIHPDDGGHYVNTWGVVVARTPDRRWASWSSSRIMMIDDRHMTGMIRPQQHVGMIWKEWESLGRPMPFAVVQGGDPGVAVVGGMPLRMDVDAAAFLGAVYGEPVELVKCETVDLEVPASAEVVIEGHLAITRDATEGPFVDFNGWVLPETSREPIYSIEAITYRNEPIWPICTAGRPPDDSQVALSLGVSAEVVALLRNANLPISTAWLLISTACHWMVVTVPRNWRQAMPGVETSEFVHRIGRAMSTSLVGRMCPVTYVFDNDIDPSCLSDVLWGLGTRVHPSRRQESWEVQILPWYRCYTDQERRSGRGSIVVHDGLLPAPEDPLVRPATFDSLYSSELQARIIAGEARRMGSPAWPSLGDLS
jgi:4-hydroxy-3-polyprenylbenzoate decarboxylase